MTMLTRMRSCWFIGALVLQANCVREREPERFSKESVPIAGRAVQGNQSDAELARKERARILMSGPILDIHPEGTARALTVRFRSRDLVPPNGETVVSLPQIQKISVERVDALRRRREPECRISGNDPIRMKEWRYGESPAGFEKLGCGELGPGEYVISAQYLGGYGGIRIVIDEQGTVTSRPLKGSTEPLWDGK